MKYQVTYTITETFDTKEAAAKAAKQYKKYPEIYQDLKASTDEFLDFLYNNPPNEIQETTEPTEEQKIAWQADLDAENRKIQEDNLFYNS